MPVKVFNSTEKQTVEIVVGSDDGGKTTPVSFRFDKDRVDEAEMSLDGTNWHLVIEAKVAIDAFVSKYPNFATE